MAVIQPEQNWRMYGGHIFNLQQYAAAGILRVLPVPDSLLTALDQTAARFIIETLPPDLTDREAAESAEERLVRRLVHWVCEVQRQARIALSARTHVRRLPPKQGQQAVRYEIGVPVSSSNAFQLAFQFVARMINEVADDSGKPSGQGEHLESRFEKLVDSLKPHAMPGFNTVHILNAAYRQDYPVRTAPGGYILIGTGAWTRMLQSTMTDETSAIGMALAQDKWTTAHLLRSLGLPAADHVQVNSEDEAVAAARKFGFPVVIKPANLDQGNGVAANLRTEQNVRAAYAAARKLSPRILLERHFHGFGHRITLYKGELVTALRRIPGGVTGDGTLSIRALLEQRRNDPDVRKNLNYGRVTLDDEALAMLAECQMTPDSVPAAGEFVMMRRRDNISAGGTSEPVAASEIHPDNLRLARRAARALLLDLAGVDLLIPDISVSWKSSGALICEVNGKPQFGPGPEGTNYDRVLQGLMGNSARIPVRLLVSPDASAAHLALAHSMADRLDLQAVASCHGLWVDGDYLCPAFPSGHAAARAALDDRDIESLLIVLTPQEMAESGLPLDRVDAVHVARHGSWTDPLRQTLQMALHLAGSKTPDIIFEGSP